MPLSCAAMQVKTCGYGLVAGASARYVEISRDKNKIDNERNIRNSQAYGKRLTPLIAVLLLCVVL